jgi:hydrogenase-1 operon protein HyaE
MNLHPLMQRLLAEHGARHVTTDSLPAWRAEPGVHALLFAGDPVRFPEALDLAVVLPELRAAFGGRFDLGLAAREHEDALARSFGVQRWPSLVFLRDGGYLGTVSGMLDWNDYLADIGRLLEAPVTRAPTVGIPVRAESPEATCH